jgi:phenylpropionate dioxygenase-like ring-hydroxylating dioxygenase large terminal subunit
VEGEVTCGNSDIVALRTSLVSAARGGPFRDYFNHWLPIALTKHIPRDRPTQLKRLGLRIVVWRDANGKVRAGSDLCPHRHAALSKGCVRDGLLECPYHGFRFDSRGDCVSVPPEGPDLQIPRALSMDMFEVREQHDVVWLWFGERRVEYPPIPFFPEVYQHRTSSYGVAYESPFDYVRFTENTLDLSHFPVVHRTTLKVAGPVVQVHDATLTDGRIHVEFSYGGGAQTKEPERFALDFQYPGTATLNVLPRVRYVIGQVPVDEHTTWFFSIVYQHYVLLPGLRWLLCWLILKFEKLFVLPQDYAIMRHQAPRDPAIAEVHLPSDVAITLWHKERARLRKRASPAKDATTPQVEAAAV